MTTWTDPLTLSPDERHETFSQRYAEARAIAAHTSENTED